MTRYAVTYRPEAFDTLARLWLDASNRSAIAAAGDEIDRALSEDASQKGVGSAKGLRQLIVSPLVVEFMVVEDDRIVRVWSIRHIGELTNGH